METQNQLESIVEQIGDAVLATTETMDRFAERVDTLVNQVQQQGYQIFALSDAIQALTEIQNESNQRIDRLAKILENLVLAIGQPDQT